MLGQVFTNARVLLVRLLLVLCLAACLVWLALCLLLAPGLVYLRSWRHKTVM